MLKINDTHLLMIQEALGIMGREIAQAIVILHQKAEAYDKLMAAKNSTDTANTADTKETTTCR